MSELDAVNQMLLAISEQKINTLESSGVLEVDVAKDTLRTVSREVQAEGWHFNTEHNLKFYPDQDGHILVPGNCIDIFRLEHYMAPVIRKDGDQLYNMTTHSYEFPIGKPVVVSLILYQPFDVLPPAARIYIAARASRIYQEEMTGSQVTDEFILRREAQARAQFEAADAREAGYNMLWDNRPGYRTMRRDRW
jgi:hypothetical protein